MVRARVRQTGVVDEAPIPLSQSSYDFVTLDCLSQTELGLGLGLGLKLERGRPRSEVSNASEVRSFIIGRVRSRHSLYITPRLYSFAFETSTSEQCRG